MALNDENLAAFFLGVWADVESSNVDRTRYDEEAQELSVKFLTSATVYTYAGVSPELAERFARAPSQGVFVSAVFRKPRWPFTTS